MPLAAPVAFPLFAIVGGKCGCGDEKCKRIGKHPKVRWKELERGSPVPHSKDGEGVGVKTGASPKGSGVIVVDLDSEAAAHALGELGEVPETFTVTTPRPSVHLYFKHPGFYVSNSAGALAQGIDIRGDGGFVVGPGSPHWSGGTYEVMVDGEPADAPEWLLEWLRARSRPPVEAKAYDGDVEGKERVRRQGLFLEHCRKAPEAREGERDAKLWPLCQHGAIDLRLPNEDILGVIDEAWNPRCRPPLDEDELRRAVLHKCDDAKTKSQRPAAEPWPDGFRTAVPAPVSEVQSKRGGVFWDDWDAHVDPPTWLIDGLIPVGTVGGLVAHGSSLKTWVMLSMAIAVTQGEKWLGRYATRQGKALIVDFESGEYELRRRVQLLEGGKVIGLGAWPYPEERIDTTEFWQAVTRIEGLSFVCIDSLAEGSTPGVDENAKEAALPMQYAARFTNGTGASVVFVHHLNKDEKKDVRSRMRGSSAIFAALDWCYGFEQIEDSDSYHRERIVCTKPCMGAKPAPFSVELTDAGLSLYMSKTPDKPKAQWTDDDIRTAIRDTIARKALSEEYAKNADLLLTWSGVDLKRGRLLLQDMVAKREVLKQSHGFVLNGGRTLIGDDDDA